ncbi:MAG: response regulator [Bacteroidota bacterium]
MNTEEKTILHIDDDADDRELLRDVMQKIAPDLKVTFAENGLQALEVLNDTKETNPLPCLIVLDLNMPFLNGRQTYERIKADPRLKNIPLVILSSGENPSDKFLFSKEGIEYFTKPVEFSVMEDIVSHMANLCA